MNISLARVIQAIQRKSSDFEFAICSPYYDIFGAANIAYYRPEEIRDFIFDAKEVGAEIIENRIYDLSDFIYKKINYKEAWLKLFGIKLDFITDDEYNRLDLIPSSVSTSNDKAYEEVLKSLPTEKFMLVQFCGGQSPLDMPADGDWSKKIYDYEHEPLKRHYPTGYAQWFIEAMKSKHPDVSIIQYALPNEPYLEGCEHFVLPYLVYYMLSKNPNCVGAVTIDSSLAHLITGNTKVMTLWGHSLPKNFGYSCNKDVVQDCRRDEILYFTPLGPSGAKVKYIEPAKLVEMTEEYFFDNSASDKKEASL